MIEVIAIVIGLVALVFETVLLTSFYIGTKNGN